ncbi:hypothetical protein [Helicobacter pylori]|uniref:hypothetical protein n=1 Tax=Helicobacter pylori TaxID=210 RepID=UPI00026AC6B5|nr:hypothetical protein HPHPH9_1453 [Helicobacter pylori Hp H-9]
MKAFVVDLDERENREVLCKFHFDRGGKVSLNTLITTSKLFQTYLKWLVRLKLSFKRV